MAVSESIKELLTINFEDSNDPQLIFDKNLHIIKTNLAFRQFSGWNHDELETYHLSDFLPGIEKEIAFFLDAAGHTEQVRGNQFDVSIITKKGKIINTKCSATQYKNYDYSFNLIKIKHIHYSFSFTTESEKLLNAIVETAVDGIITINEKGEMRTVNKAACTHFGYHENELLGKNVSILMPEPDRSSHNTYISNYLKTGEKKIIGIGREVQGRRKDGSLFPMKLSISEIDLNGEKVFAGIIHDITDLRKAESRVQELSKEKELNELKSRFISMASHEFRTPLTTILSSVSLIGKYVLSEEQEKRQKHIDRIKTHVNHMTSLLNDFLSITKLEEGKVSIAYQLFDLERFCKEIAEEMQGIAKAGQKIIFKHTSERTLVWQDPNILRNIIFNLVGNALKYSPENSPVYITSSANENEILITVADKGIGIPKKDQALMFERFFRAGNSTNIQGTGLGLNIVKKYLENLEGSISFKSEENIGTTFYITLPIKD